MAFKYYIKTRMVQVRKYFECLPEAYLLPCLYNLWGKIAHNISTITDIINDWPVVTNVKKIQGKKHNIVKL